MLFEQVASHLHLWWIKKNSFECQKILVSIDILPDLRVISRLVIPPEISCRGYIMCVSNKLSLCSKSWRTSYFCLCNFDLYFPLKVPSQTFCSFRHRPRDHVWMTILSLLQKSGKVWFNILLFLSDIAVILKIQSFKLCNNKYIIVSTQITNTELFALIYDLIFKLLSRTVLFKNKKNNRNYEKVSYFLRKK